MSVQLSVLIVNYNTLRLLQDCLASLPRHLHGKTSFEVVVVDNASKDGSAEWLAAQSLTMPWMHVVLSETNLGFAGGNNAGLPHCHGQYVLLLNSDAYLIDDSVCQGLAFLDSHPDYFGSGACLHNPDGSNGPSYGFFPSPFTLWRELTGPGLGTLRAVSPLSDEGIHDIDFPCGAYFLVRQSHLAQVGRLDAGYFLYFEETDWALRAWKHGLRIAYLPQCRAVHVGGGSSQDRRPVRIVALFYESWRRYLLRHHSFYGLPCVLAMLLPYYLLATGKNLLQARFSNADRFGRQVLGLLWGFSGRPSLKLRPKA